MWAVKLYDLWSATGVPVGFKVLSHLSVTTIIILCCT